VDGYYDKLRIIKLPKVSRGAYILKITTENQVFNA